MKKRIYSILLLFIFSFTICFTLFSNTITAIENYENLVTENQDENIITKNKLKEEVNKLSNENSNIMKKSTATTYTLAIAQSNGTFTNVKSYDSFNDAKNAMNKNSNANAVVRSSSKAGNKVIAMKDGIAISRPYRINNASTMTIGYSYISNGHSLFYYDTTSASYATVGISGQKGSAKLSQLELIPRVVVNSWSNSTKQSYYYVKNGNLYHQLAYYSNNNTGTTKPSTSGTFVVCAAPSFMSTGKKYYSMDGINFYRNANLTSKIGVNYNYYQFLPIRTKTKYTSTELNKYIADNVSSGKIYKNGSAFINAQNKYGVNGATLLSIAILESGWGKSYYAMHRNNLFGISAYDSDPDQASSFSSVANCVNRMAYRYVSQGYMDVLTDFRYYGGVVGNKAAGMNVKYASDPYWGEKIGGRYYCIDKFLGKKDYNNYSVGIANKGAILYKKTTGTSSYYSFKGNKQSVNFYPVPVVILKSYNSRYKVASDASITSSGVVNYKTIYNPTNSYGYVNISNVKKVTSLNTYKPSTPKINAYGYSYSSNKIKWNKINNASKYRIYVSTSKDGTYSKVADTTSTSYIHKKRITGKTYYYKVRAINAQSVYSSYSNYDAAKPVCKSPSLTLKTNNYCSIKVSWTKISGASGYNVYRKTSGGKYSLVKTTSKSRLYFNDKDKLTGTTYYYYVRAYTNVNKSKVYGNSSAVKSITPKVSAPKISGKRSSNTKSTITWKHCLGASGYKIYRRATTSKKYTILKYTPYNSYTDRNLSKDKNYYYYVRAYRVIKGSRKYSNLSNRLRINHL